MTLTLPAGVVSQVRRRAAGHDLPLAAAGVTFYAAVAAVPLLLLAVRLVGACVGHAWTAQHLAEAGRLLPPPGRDAVRFVTDHGLQLSWPHAVASVLPIGLYGEGLVRAFARLSPEKVRRRPLRGRALVAVLVPATVGVLALSLLAVQVVGRPGVLLGVYLAFLVAWVLATALLALGYRLVTPETPGPPALWGPAVAVGSVVAGVGLGFVWFLHLSLDVGALYGGSTGLGLTAIAALWVYALHLVALAGFSVAVGWERASDEGS